MQPDDPIVDVAFPVQGHEVPYDHGYPLYGALSRIVPAVHQTDRVGRFQTPSTSTADGEESSGPECHAQGPGLRHPARLT